MTASEFDRVRRNYRKFRTLEPEEQARLRRLRADIERHPERARLVAVMRRYHEWVRELSPDDRDELLNTPSKRRMEKLRELLRQQPPARVRGRSSRWGRFFGGRAGLERTRRPFGGRRGRGGRFPGRPTPLNAWLQERVEAGLDRNQAEQLQRAGTFERLSLIAQFAEDQQLLAGAKPLGPEKLSEEELRLLVARMPRDDRDRLNKMTPTAQREWLGWQLRLSVLRMSTWSRLGNELPSIANSELQAFKTDEVPRDHGVWDYLDGLNPLRYKRALTRLYLMAHPGKRRPAPEQPAPQSQREQPSQ